MEYKIAFTRQAKRELHKIHQGNRKQYQRIKRAIGGLAQDPYPQGSITLSGRSGRRIRVGNYRVLYSVEEQEVLVEVFTIGARGNVYKR
ncbi:type II toxin-antitoxin system RelE family toxin [Corynebacterium yonathiae]|uniref:Type II toxin-antitoxin system mRNA interferase toxin, RelE/StbE family n=1 Tax=Corynebacterium yonathiae TaxID=2913504 RepID=A0A9X3LYT8_9CORY|nr:MULTISPECIES: type II toxin-antitoxin system mRNA interferase toxin, RelE/StbE family [Corynebacterium]MCZ9296191.1 type II toxin-antitoxin system mRNA interferase toxin, RelE/StbE family [Corynebacterium yonathiae]MDK2583075.1 type II toxin-antitoxin system mRNA interferase toxin, RelE/StbE family [Corynebacterium sp. BWA136]